MMKSNRISHEYELVDKHHTRSPSTSNLDHPTNQSTRPNYQRILFLTILVVIVWISSLVIAISLTKKSSLLRTPELVYNMTQDVISIATKPKVPVVLNEEVTWSDSIKLVDFEIEGPSDFTDLKALCTETVWVHNRYFTCNQIQGGIGNVRNAVLNCIRYTIQAGAALVLPVLYRRGALADPASQLSAGGREGLGYVFDLNHFTSTLRQFCPQLIIIDNIKDVPHFESAQITEPFRFRDVYAVATGNPPPGIAESNTHAAAFRSDFEKVNGQVETRIKIYRTLLAFFDWELSLDSTGFWQNFGRLLKFRKDTILLASEVYSNLIHIDLTVGVGGGSYFGCHLRSEADAPPSWTNSSLQMAKYIQQAKSSDLKIIYVASGDPDEIIQFRKIALEEGLIVYGKEDLLSRLSLKYAKTISFDQTALIDYLIMLKSKDFGGVGFSSFSQSIASRRHLISKTPKTIIPPEGDELSSLLDGALSPTFRITTWP